ncbi:DsbA family protein [Mesorhizobium sp. M0800]|uniref:2-hydroxychromene-2-carboxylate isomerase n=1 Tax=Mesorhizobium sp. M0800 TaxID=2957000 RepID=UPI00333A7E02
MIEFWFCIGSTYSYLSVMRLAHVEAATGVRFSWRPFNLRTIMIEMDNIPFRTKPVKEAYMWRDVERRGALYGLLPKLPAPYPLAELERANCVAIIGAAEGWCSAYARESYRRWFEAGEPAGSEPNLSASISAAGQDVKRVLRLADSDKGKADLVHAAEEAKALGIFGSPSFIVDGELFWGDDRLDDAVRWLRQMERGPPD